MSDAKAPTRPLVDRTVLYGRNGDTSGLLFYAAAESVAAQSEWWICAPSLNCLPDAAVQRARAVLFHGTLTSRERRFVRSRLDQEWLWLPPAMSDQWWWARPGAPDTWRQAHGRRVETPLQVCPQKDGPHAQARIGRPA